MADFLLWKTNTVLGKVEESSARQRFAGSYLPWHGHITALTVAPQYRRMGLARKLSEALEINCDRLNAWFVDLFVRTSNETALALYKGMG